MDDSLDDDTGLVVFCLVTESAESSDSFYDGSSEDNEEGESD